MVFLFALSVVVDDLLDQRTGLQRRKRRCSSMARHLILGIAWAVVGLYTSTSCLVVQGEGLPRRGTTCQGVPTAIAPLKDLENFCNQYIFLFPCGPGGGSGVGPGWVRGRVLAGPFGIQLAVANFTSSYLFEMNLAVGCR